jgi:hypothetical protein
MCQPTKRTGRAGVAAEARPSRASDSNQGKPMVTAAPAKKRRRLVPRLAASFSCEARAFSS